MRRAGHPIAVRAPRQVEFAPVDLPEPGPDTMLVRTRTRASAPEPSCSATEACWSPISRSTNGSGPRRHLQLSVPLRLQLCGRGRALDRSGPGGNARLRVPSAPGPVRDRTDDVVALPPGTDPRGHAVPVRRDRAAAQPRRRAGGAGDRRRPGSGCGRRDHRAAAQRAGATVIAADPSDERRDLAVSLGIPAVDPDGLSARLSSQGVPLLLELSGSPTALAGAWTCCPTRHRARRVVVRPAAGRAAARWRVPPTPDDPQQPGVHHPAALAGRWDVARRRRVAVGLLGELPLARWPRPSSRSGRRRRPTRSTAANRVSSTSRSGDRALSIAPCTRRGQRCRWRPFTSCRACRRPRASGTRTTTGSTSSSAATTSTTAAWSWTSTCWTARCGTRPHGSRARTWRRSSRPRP